MTRYLSIIILFITLGSCQKDDDSASPTPPSPSGTFSEFCPNTTGFPEIPGWQYQKVEIPESIGHNWQPYFLNADKGFLFNSSGNLIRTNDRGENWDILYSWWNYSPIQVFFLEDQKIVPVGVSSLLKKML